METAPSATTTKANGIHAQSCRRTFVSPRLPRKAKSAMTVIPPTMSGSSHPVNLAARHHGTTNAIEAPSASFQHSRRARHPSAATRTKNGRSAVTASCSNTMEEVSTPTSSPVSLARTLVGTPTEPKAVGVEFATRQQRTALAGSKPTPTRIAHGIATAVPKPAIPSMKFPKPHATSSARKRLSEDSEQSPPLMSAIAPDVSVIAYVKSAANMTSPIGNKPVETPCAAHPANSPADIPRQKSASAAPTTSAARAAFHAGAFTTTSAATRTAIGRSERTNVMLTKSP